MNTLSHFIARLTLISLFSVCFNNFYAANPSKTQTMNTDSSYFQIKGKITIGPKKTKDRYTLEVMYFDSTVSSFVIENDKPFMLIVKKDSPYTLKISKKGYIVRSICINTSVNEPTNRHTPYTFSIETDLIGVAQAMRLDSEALELPVALIAYNKTTGDFDHNLNYSLFVKQKINPGMMMN